mgnify:CR=1 FL=1
MAVNELSFNQLSTVLADIVSQATGQAQITPTDTSSFVSVAQAGLLAGYDPLMTAISLHGGVLYGSYLATYLINGWLERGIVPLLAFTGIFVVGYLLIWAIIYTIIKKNTDKVNEMLKKKQQEGSF